MTLEWLGTPSKTKVSMFMTLIQNKDIKNYLDQSTFICFLSTIYAPELRINYIHKKLISSLNKLYLTGHPRPRYNSEQGDECIDFTMTCSVCFFLFLYRCSLFSITCRNHASISNFGGGFRWQN
ncbi:Uncharacterized protein FWK35_00000388 [Aphis craccivora]|uniref:Uncharacterized protein n=1 Tax=Aphis craccivora TaxID=307492 RepID=A0A6G0ZKB3_APHCR|nr:Uncharacterized protein FWK35_00000388 [Aphis craccivora]